MPPRVKGDGRGKLGGGMQVGMVTAKVRERAEQAQKHRELDAAAVIEQIARGALYDPRDFYYAEDDPAVYDADGPPVEGWQGDPPAPLQWLKGERMMRWRRGDLRPLHELTEAQAQAIAGIEVIMKNAVAGDGQIDRVLKLKFVDRSKYVDMAGRYHALFRDKIELVGLEQSIERLIEGRLRARARNQLTEGAIETTATVVNVTPAKKGR